MHYTSGITWHTGNIKPIVRALMPMLRCCVLSTYDAQLVDMRDVPLDFNNYSEIYIAGIAEAVRDLVRIPALQGKLLLKQQLRIG